MNRRMLIKAALLVAAVAALPFAGSSAALAKSGNEIRANAEAALTRLYNPKSGGSALAR